MAPKASVRRLEAFLLLLLGMLSLLSCQSPRSATSTLEGRWTSTDGQASIEFWKDGTVSVIARGESLKGNYRIENRRLEIELRHGSLPPRTLKGTVSRDKLVLTNAKGETATYQRVNEESGT